MNGFAAEANASPALLRTLAHSTLAEAVFTPR